MTSTVTLGMMSMELLYGIFISMLNIAIQAIVSVALIRYMRNLQTRSVKRHRVLALAGAMMATGAILTFSHMVQVWIWANAYDLVGVVRSPDAYYFAFVNFTTLGYGDIIGEQPWRILGPVTAANGMLLFGMSTALIFAVMTRAGTVLHVYDRPTQHKTTRRAKGNSDKGQSDKAHSDKGHPDKPHPEAARSDAGGEDRGAPVPPS